MSSSMSVIMKYFWFTCRVTIDQNESIPQAYFQVMIAK